MKPDPWQEATSPVCRNLSRCSGSAAGLGGGEAAFNDMGQIFEEMHEEKAAREAEQDARELDSSISRAEPWELASSPRTKAIVPE